MLWLQLFHLSQLLLLHIWRSARGKAFRLTLIPGDTRCCTLAEAKGIYFGHILNPFVWKALPNINVIISISCLCRIIYGWHDTLTFHHQPLRSFFFSFFWPLKSWQVQWYHLATWLWDLTTSRSVNKLHSLCHVWNLQYFYALFSPPRNEFSLSQASLHVHAISTSFVISLFLNNSLDISKLNELFFSAFLPQTFVRNYRFLWLTRQSWTNKSIQSKWKQIESIKAKLLREKNQTQCSPQNHGRRQLMAVGAKRCWLIKPGQPCAWRQGQQPDQSRPAQTSLLSCRPTGRYPSTCSCWKAKTQGCVWFPENKKKAELEEMSFSITSPFPSAPPTYLRLVLYPRNGKQQGATEDLQISVSQRGGLSRAAMSN